LYQEEDMNLLAGKVAIVTGGASGIGAATARRLSSEGAGVLIADISGPGATAMAQELIGAGGAALGIEVDVSKPDDVHRMVKTAVDEFGRLDVLHNNAAAFGADVIMQDFNVVDVDIEVWHRTLAVNLTGAFLGCRYAVPAMLAVGGGSIINMSSIAGWFAEPVRVSYSVSKGALINLTKHVATAFGKQRIRCNAVAPGVVVTDTQRQHMGDEWIKTMEERHAVPQLARPEDVADVVCFLASDMSRQVNGHVLVVDGGLTASLPTS
jgi:NAD(P)-dependent dehydrogenase (short-subunit alcohol dehydrogenase family)